MDEKEYSLKLGELLKIFGHPSLRCYQDEIVKKIILERKDVFAILPTSAGKSVCFQFPALMLEGLTIVITPLIVLMKDQVTNIQKRGKEAVRINSPLNVRADFINSDVSDVERAKIIKDAKDGKIKLLYLAPEQLKKTDVSGILNAIDVPMVVVDEAHCISEWGHSFRPDYLRINEFIKKINNKHSPAPVLALFTATATERVKKDIIRSFDRFRDGDPYVKTISLDRKELILSVKKSSDKFNDLLSILKEHKGKNGIVYCSTTGIKGRDQKGVRNIYKKLKELGYPAVWYHGDKKYWNYIGNNIAERNIEKEKRDKVEKNNNLREFINGNAKIMVATSSFGMGVDKKDVDFVVHYTMPMNIESYYQGAGRAGRDGRDADCIFLYDNNDKGDRKTNEWLIEKNKEYYKVDPDEYKKYQFELLDKLEEYAKTEKCYTSFILNYFGETSIKTCGHCEYCIEHKFTGKNDATTTKKIIKFKKVSASKKTEDENIQEQSKKHKEAKKAARKQYADTFAIRCDEKCIKKGISFSGKITEDISKIDILKKYGIDSNNEMTRQLLKEYLDLNYEYGQITIQEFDDDRIFSYTMLIDENLKKNNDIKKRDFIKGEMVGIKLGDKYLWKCSKIN